MSAPAPPDTARPTRPWRTWLLVGLALAAALVVALWTMRGVTEYAAPYDPRNPGPDGAQAVARVLDGQGVDVTVARSADAFGEAVADGAGATVVVTGTDALSPSTLRRLLGESAGRRVVLVDPSYFLLDDAGADIETVSTSIGDPVAADCATAYSGPDLSGLEIEVDSATAYDVDGCFPTDDRSLLGVARLDGHEVLLLGAAQAITNDQVVRADNAAAALRLLGQDQRLVWYVPDPADTLDGEAVTLGTLIPEWVVPAVWLLLLAGIGLVLWRARRLGPLSTEPLPVVVRAIETTLSRGRMYRRAGDRAHAAAALRRATRADLATHLRTERGAAERVVSEAVAAHLAVPVATIIPLLEDSPAPPASDADLVRLAEELARITREVRSR